MMKNYLKIIILMVLTLLFSPKIVFAVPIPEITNNFSMIFSQIIFFVSLAFSFLYVFLKKIIVQIIKNPVLRIVSFFLFVIFLSGVIFFLKTNKIKEAQKNLLIYDLPDSEIDESLTIDSTQLKKILEAKEENYVLFDARFFEEYRAGHIKGAKFWDMSWDGKLMQEVSDEFCADKQIIFHCYGGVRSGIVATKFSRYCPTVRFLDEPPLQFFDFWEGDVFEYGMEHTEILSLDTVVEESSDGAILLDPRGKDLYEKKHAFGAYNIPIPNISYETVSEEIKKLPVKKNYIIVCYDRMSCFEGHLLSKNIDFVRALNLNSIGKTLGLFVQGELLEK